MQRSLAPSPFYPMPCTFSCCRGPFDSLICNENDEVPLFFFFPFISFFCRSIKTSSYQNPPFLCTVHIVLFTFMVSAKLFLLMVMLMTVGEFVQAAPIHSKLKQDTSYYSGSGTFFYPAKSGAEGACGGPKQTSKSDTVALVRIPPPPP